MYSTARSWNDVAIAYDGIVETQLKGFRAAGLLPKFASGASREEKIRAIVEKLNREIRYTGLEFSEGSIVPHTPAEVMEHQYGDCKDKSALAVALLRAAGIEAHVALLLSTTGEDVEPDLPGIDAFDHAIVYAPGNPGIWLDLTDPDLRIGVVSPPNQGRLALVVSPKTAALLRTPELSAGDNRTIETREFVLAELGRAKITETTETFGTADREYRGSFAEKDEEKLRDSLKDYIADTYGEAKIAKITKGEDENLAKPYRLKIELEDAQRGFSARTEAAVGIFVSKIASRLPSFFLTEPKSDAGTENSTEKVKEQPRTEDFAIANPFVTEWRYRITAPDGFKIRQLPEAASENIGIAKLESSFARVSDTEITGTLRFAMEQRRFSAALGLALRDAVVSLSKRKPLLIYFDQVGETRLESGDVKGALTEFRRLQKLHPNEALHSMQFARALLAAGAGDSARKEARRAVELDPASQAYVQLAEILKHDLIGRPLARGYDRDGAVDAYRKALELKPDDVETRANLAILLEHDMAGVRYGSGARLNEAVEEYAKIQDKLDSVGVTPNYPIALFMSGHMKEAIGYLRNRPETEINQVTGVAAEAVLNGSKAAIERAGTVSGVAAKQKVLSSAAQSLLSIRRYDLAADLLDAAAAGAGNPPAVTNLIQVLRKTKPVDQVPDTAKSPEETIRILFWKSARATNPRTDFTSLFSPLFRDDPSIEPRRLRRDLAQGRGQASSLTTEVLSDLSLSAIQFSVQGSDDLGYVIRLLIPGSQSQAVFVIREDNDYRIVGISGGYSGIARLALKLGQEGKLDAARLWLDRARQETPAGNGDDPISGSLFARVWQEGQMADAAKIKLGASLLLIDSSVPADQMAATFEEARAHAEGASEDALLAALSQVYFHSKDYSKSLAAGEELMKRLPQSPTALGLAVRAAYAKGGIAEGDREANSNLERFKQNPTALRVAALNAMIFGDSDRSTAINKQIVASGRAEAGDYNQIAWADLMAGKATADSLEAANKGMLLSNNQSTGIMHTVAAVQAELGKEGDARAMLLQRMKTENAEEPDDEELYVFGRIAEQYGLEAEAAGLYRKLSRPKDELAIPVTSYALAQRRLKAMNAQ